MKKMPRMLYLGIFLLCLGLIAGGLLAGVNALTKPVIEENEKKALEERLSAVEVKEPIALETELLDGVVGVYSCTYNGESAYVFNCTHTNKFTTVSMLIVYTKDGVVRANASGSPTLSTHGKDGDLNKAVEDIKTFKTVSGATFSSNSITACLEAAKAQFEKLGGLK